MLEIVVERSMFVHLLGTDKERDGYLLPIDHRTQAQMIVFISIVKREDDGWRRNFSLFEHLDRLRQ